MLRPITCWKESLLLRAYRKGIYGDSFDTLSGDEENDHTWRVGDYCRAKYSGDGLLYECQVTSVFKDFCTVKFLGYDNTEDVGIEDLGESHGKQARREQIRIARAVLDEIVDENGDSSDGSDGSGHFHSLIRRAGQSVADGAVCDDPSPRRLYRASQSVADGAVCDDPSPRRLCRASQSAADGAVCADHSHRRCRASHYAAAPSMAANQLFMPSPTSMPQGSASFAPFMLPQIPGPHGPPVLPQGPGIQAPPMMPQCPIPSNEMPAILSAWYMAGYYTGMHEAERGSQGCHCCRNHSNQRISY